ncbi:unnamed protein product [Acanthoscelides obtectus]|uniref:Uncharacterized protein n=1 Tax=Acanthoscelides obtectus TaxID=200917 RepID=A0A9P0PBP9_ACAOB|nr:unnamed protein product [Acanthoscelides obtectus]CAK1651940.1 hypothetical protein AOBTE_LOCUS17562 [Acanthoscelides obtectus]
MTAGPFKPFRQWSHRFCENTHHKSNTLKKVSFHAIQWQHGDLCGCQRPFFEGATLPALQIILRLLYFYI